MGMRWAKTLRILLALCGGVMVLAGVVGSVLVWQWVHYLPTGEYVDIEALKDVPYKFVP